MGFWDVLRGQSTPKAAKLDQLFALPSAAWTLESALGLVPTGSGSVCYRAAEGRASALVRQEADDLVTIDDGPAMQQRVDGYGYTWLTATTTPPDVSTLVTQLHAVNSSLELEGFGPGLLCSTVNFTDQPGGATSALLVYLYKQGTFYPFCPTGPSSRDTLKERQIRDAVGADLPIEQDLSRWMPIWDAR